MKATAHSLLTFFQGRRFALLPLAAAALMGIPLFLLFPPAVLPAVLTGGGSAGPLAASVASASNGMTRRYLTLNQGETVDLAPGPVSFAGHPQLLRRVGATWNYRAVAAGNTVLVAGAGKTKRQVFVFVSPLPSRHVTRNDIDWYKSQWGTGIANCGPAVAAMAITWSKGVDVSVQAIRDEIGYPYEDGSTSFDNLQDALDRHRVSSRSPTLAAPADLRSILDRGHLALVLIQDGDIEKVKGDPTTDLVGRYYDDDEGHYVLVKGYSLNRGYFVVYDPYPVDWETNDLRYGDDVSMIGKNRYFPTQQLWNALKTRSVLEVLPGR